MGWRERESKSNKGGGNRGGLDATEDGPRRSLLQDSWRNTHIYTGDCSCTSQLQSKVLVGFTSQSDEETTWL